MPSLVGSEMCIRDRWSSSTSSRGDRQSDGLGSRVSGVSGISGNRDSEGGCSSGGFPGRWFGPPAPKLQAPPNAALPPPPAKLSPGPEDIHVPTHVPAHTALRPTQGGFASGSANGSANVSAIGPASGFANVIGCRGNREGTGMQVSCARPPPPPRSRPRPLVVNGGVGGGGERQLPSERWPEQQCGTVNRSPCVVPIAVPLASGPRGGARFGESPPMSPATASIGMSSAASSSSLESVDLAATPEEGAAPSVLSPAGAC